MILNIPRIPIAPIFQIIMGPPSPLPCSAAVLAEGVAPRLNACTLCPPPPAAAMRRGRLLNVDFWADFRATTPGSTCRVRRARVLTPSSFPIYDARSASFRLPVRVSARSLLLQVGELAKLVHSQARARVAALVHRTPGGGSAHGRGRRRATCCCACAPHDRRRI